MGSCGFWGKPGKHWSLHMGSTVRTSRPAPVICQQAAIGLCMSLRRHAALQWQQWQYPPLGLAAAAVCLASCLFPLCGAASSSAAAVDSSTGAAGKHSVCMLLLCRQQSRFCVLQQGTSKLCWLVFVLAHVCGVFSHVDMHSVVCWLQFLMTRLISMLAHLHGSFV